MSDQRDYPREHYRDSYEDRAPRNYDSDYEEGEDPVAFVNIIDMDIPFFQLVWLIFKILLATIVAAGVIGLLAALLMWVLNHPAVQALLPDGANWFRSLLGR